MVSSFQNSNPWAFQPFQSKSTNNCEETKEPWFRCAGKCKLDKEPMRYNNNRKYVNQPIMYPRTIQTWSSHGSHHLRNHMESADRSTDTGDSCDVQRAAQKLLHDVKSLTTRRVSKYQPKNRRTNHVPFSEQSIQYILSHHRDLLQVYDSDHTECDVSMDTSPLSRLVQTVGLMHKDHLIAMITRHPTFMATVLRSDTLRTNHVQFCQDLLLTESESDQLLASTQWKEYLQRMYRCELRDTLLFFLNKLSFSRTELKQVILKNPQLLRYSLSKFQSNVELFQNEFAFDRNEIKKMVQMQPLVLVYSIEGKIRPLVSFLKDDVCVEAWKRLIYRYPKVLSVSLTSIQSKTALLDKQLLLQRKSDRSAIIAGFPPLLWLSTDNMTRKIIFLTEAFELEKEEVRNIIVSFPQILSLSIEKNLKPKIDYLLKSQNDYDGAGGGLSRNQLKELFLYQPALIAYSLQNRIKPRIQRMHSHSISFSLVPYYLMSMSDEKFEHW